MPGKRTIYRRSDNGQITTKKYAHKHPKTTERQHVAVPKPKKK
jgi:hypothetical protein